MSHNYQFLAFSEAAEVRFGRLMQREKLIDGLPIDAPAGGAQNTMRDVLGVGVRMAKARIAGAEGRKEDELLDLRRAVDFTVKRRYE